MTAMTAVPTEALVSQLALMATWTHLDDQGSDPIRAALEVLDQTPSAAIIDEVRTAIATAADDLDFTEQVAFALHLLLTTDEPTRLLVA